MLVDTLGLLMAVVVTAGDVQDEQGALRLIAKSEEFQKNAKVLWADSAYNRESIRKTLNKKTNAELELKQRPEGARGFVVIPKRWIVERSNAWVSGHRRTQRDHERTVKSSESWVYISQIKTLLNRI